MQCCFEILILQIIIPADPDSNYIATIHRHRSNSKIYMAKKDGHGVIDENVDMDVFNHDTELELPAVTKTRYVTRDNVG